MECSSLKKLEIRIPRLEIATCNVRPAIIDPFNKKGKNSVRRKVDDMSSSSSDNRSILAARKQKTVKLLLPLQNNHVIKFNPPKIKKRVSLIKCVRRKSDKLFSPPSKNKDMKGPIPKSSKKLLPSLDSCSNKVTVSTSVVETTQYKTSDIENFVVGNMRDNCFDECLRIFKLNTASVSIPCMKTGELKGGVPVVRVNDDVFRVPKEIKEQIEKDNQVYPILNSKEEDRKGVWVKNEFNSSSVFFEEEEKVFDRAYFHIFSTELCGENEICLNGVFVEES